MCDVRVEVWGACDTSDVDMEVGCIVGMFIRVLRAESHECAFVYPRLSKTCLWACDIKGRPMSCLLLHDLLPSAASPWRRATLFRSLPFLQRHECSLDLTQFLLARFENLQIVLLQLLKILVQLLMPWIQDKDLKSKSRGSDEEVGEREASCDMHGEYRKRVVYS